jgi:signal peptidase II
MSAPAFPWRESGLRWWWIAVAAIVLDQLSKLWIVTNLQLTSMEARGDEIALLPVLNIIHTTNYGAAWSMFAIPGGMQRWVFSALAVVVSGVLAFWLRRLSLATQKLLITGLSLILGGAIGNVLDRLRLGHVVDFIQVHWGMHYFPTFNVADSAITVGAALVVLDALAEAQRERRAKAGATGADNAG